MTTISKNGFLYCAVGNDYYKRAVRSYQSVQLVNPSLKASIYTDNQKVDEYWEMIIPSVEQQAVSDKNMMIYKLDALLTTPYEKTIYLDADTLVLENIDELFLLLDKFDLILCHGHNRNKRFNLIRNAVTESGNNIFSAKIPYCFSPLQGGLIIYNKRTTLDFFKKLKEKYLSLKYFDDQAILRELLWDNNLRFYILPPEYNFNSLKYLQLLKRNNFEIARPKIFHYTKHRHDNVDKLISKVNGIYCKRNINRKANFQFTYYIINKLKRIFSRFI